MMKIRVALGIRLSHEGPASQFTVLVTPVSDGIPRLRRGNKVAGRVRRFVGYKVTVPALPGVITYGRTHEEALEMASDAVVCHVEGLRKRRSSRNPAPTL